MNLKHIYWFAHYNLTCPSTRYRGIIPLNHLSQIYGVGYDFVFPERSLKGIAKFFRIYLSSLFFRKSNSMIVVQKVCSNGIYANLLKLLIVLRPNCTQYDLDDAEYYRSGTQSLHFFLRHCKTISVGSAALKAYCLQFNPNVSILTSPVSKHGVVKKRKRNNKLHIGWVGDFGNGKIISRAFSQKTSLFELLFPALRNVKHQVKVILIGVTRESDIAMVKDYFKDIPNVALEIPTDLNWQDDRWLYNEISRFDIGISAISNHPFNQSKSAFKVKQYLSVGVPVAASNVGENKRFTINSKNGFLCEKSEDFLRAIDCISEMADSDYNQMCENAIENRQIYSVENYCKMLMAFYSKQINLKKMVYTTGQKIMKSVTK